MTRKQIDAMIEFLRHEAKCPACDRRGLWVKPLPTKGRHTCHGVDVKCLKCGVEAQLRGLPGWGGQRALATIVEDILKERDRRVAKELMSCG